MKVVDRQARDMQALREYRCLLMHKSCCVYCCTYLVIRTFARTWSLVIVYGSGLLHWCADPFFCTDVRIWSLVLTFCCTYLVFCAAVRIWSVTLVHEICLVYWTVDDFHPCSARANASMCSFFVGTGKHIPSRHARSPRKWAIDYTLAVCTGANVRV